MLNDSGVLSSSNLQTPTDTSLSMMNNSSFLNSPPLIAIAPAIPVFRLSNSPPLSPLKTPKSNSFGSFLELTEFF